MIYLAGWAAAYSVLFVQAITRYKGPVLIFGVILFFASIAFFRGTVGTDTGTYGVAFSRYLDSAWNGQEPGFIVLGAALTALFQDATLAVRAVALVFFFLAAVYIKRADQNEKFFFLAYVLPLMGYQYSMNIIRDGLATIIVILAVQAFRKGSFKRAFFTGIPAIFFHYSSLFSLSYIAISQRPWLRFLSVAYTLGLLVFSTLAFLVAELYFVEKALLYAPEAEAKGSSQVVASLFGFFRVSIILGVLLFGKLPTGEKLKLIVLGELFLLTAAFVSQYSYAGIRLYLLVSIVCPLSILASYSRLGLKFERGLKAALIASSLLGAAAAYKGFLSTKGQNLHAFLPYDTWLW
jgi:hypothetical protein|tara:strand:+ start:2760 stop:3809 length:1050 start_codon:yes stop_codon:yes gene_type:complete